ncbi:MAG TPA: hypothetical protein VFN49_06925 [Candidatus Aquilonibacter sp.]|nr:hypothetical protein [Candidatus Aquilonibacter sp.]
MIEDRELRERLLHAIDLAAAREWEEAKALVEPMGNAVSDRLFLLLSSLEEREEARNRQLAVVRHEIGNSLSIARANLEGIIDGLLTATPQRLIGLVRALESASGMLESLRHTSLTDSNGVVSVQQFDACELIGSRIDGLRGMAAAKRVDIAYATRRHTEEARFLRGDASLIGNVVEEAILNAIRLTPPGGSIAIECRLHDHQLELRITNHQPRAELMAIKRLVASIGGEAFVETRDGEKHTVLIIDLPLE